MFLRALRVTRYLVHLCLDTSPCGGDRSLGNTDMTPCLWGSVWSAPHAEACAQGPFLPPCHALCQPASHSVLNAQPLLDIPASTWSFSAEPGLV